MIGFNRSFWISPWICYRVYGMFMYVLNVSPAQQQWQVKVFLGPPSKIKRKTSARCDPWKGAIPKVFSSFVTSFFMNFLGKTPRLLETCMIKTNGCTANWFDMCNCPCQKKTCWTKGSELDSSLKMSVLTILKWWWWWWWSLIIIID